MINFVIPSIGRSTLKNTLQSLIDQTNTNWQCWVGFDGLDKSQVDQSILVYDDRIHYLYLKEKLGIFGFNSGINHTIGNAGFVRNYIISNIFGNDYEWIGFVDDDDTLRPYYIEKLQEEIDYTYFDCCIFRMKCGELIIPPIGMIEVVQNSVGISFCVQKKFIVDNNINFLNSSSEDYAMLETINNYGGIIYMSEYVTYNVLGESI